MSEVNREFQRILNIPRRTPWSRDYARNLVEPYTAKLKTPNGTQSLFPQQALALKEIHRVKGGLIPFAVGEGKALVSLLAPRALGCSRPLLVIPASLREQTIREVIPQALEHWNFPVPMVHSYTEFSLAKNADLLERLRPDCIMFDEAHRISSTRSARTRRFLRYLKKTGLPVIVLSGTLIKKSVMDFAHLSSISLKALSPLPNNYRLLEEFSGAIDRELKPSVIGKGKTLKRRFPNTRKWFHYRLAETPGVVNSWGVGVSASLNIEIDAETYVPDSPELTDAVVKWVDPNGLYIEEALERWRYLQQLSMGFYYKWKYPAPEEWLDARREWSSYAAAKISSSRGRYDSKLQVAMDKPPEYMRWLTVRDTFKPETLAVWIDTTSVKKAVAWAKRTGGIVWTQFRAFGQACSAAGLSYYGAGDSVLKANGPVCMSIAAHGEGKNLQRWCTNLFTLIPTSAKVCEQTIGRTHRTGQKADEVNITVWGSPGIHSAAFKKARDRAKHVEEVTGVRQKLNAATIFGGSARESKLETVALDLMGHDKKERSNGI